MCAGGGATVLLLFLLYAPNGIWKIFLVLLIAVTLLVMLWNPRYRLFGIGTASALTGVGGFVTEWSFSATATMPGGKMFTAGIEGGSNVPPLFFLMLLIVGVVTIAFDNVGRGWIWSSMGQNDPAQPNLTFALEREIIPLSDYLAPIGQGRFHAGLIASKAKGQPVRLVRAEMEDANILELAVGHGDGVQRTLVIDRASAEISILGTFPRSALTKGSAKRELVIIDEFNRKWPAGTVEFHFPS